MDRDPKKPKHQLSGSHRRLQDVGIRISGPGLGQGRSTKRVHGPCRYVVCIN